MPGFYQFGGNNTGGVVNSRRGNGNSSLKNSNSKNEKTATPPTTARARLKCTAIAHESWLRWTTTPIDTKY